LAARRDLRFARFVTALEFLFAKLKAVCADLPDRRKGRRDDDH